MQKRLSTAIILSVILLALALTLPAEAARAHVVQPGETLTSIALRYGLSMEALAQANGLADPDLVRVGQVLTIPEADLRAHNSLAENSRQAGRVQGRAQAVTYTVRSGDNLYNIARRFGLTVRALIEFNRLDTDTLRVGQKLRIPSAIRPSTPVQGRPLGQPVRAVLASPLPILRGAIGMEAKALRALRVRGGPKTYFGTVALVAAETPLRIIGEEPGWYQVQLRNAAVGWVREGDVRLLPQASTSVPAPRSVGAAEIVREALEYLGTPYLWGGQSPRGVDCSGLVYVVFGRHLQSLTRTSSFDYFHVGVPVERSGLQPGDLVFFTTYAPGPSHVGIYVGDGKFVHASTESRRVATSSLEESYYAARYVGARRWLAP